MPLPSTLKRKDVLDESGRIDPRLVNAFADEPEDFDGVEDGVTLGSGVFSGAS